MRTPDAQERIPGTVQELKKGVLEFYSWGVVESEYEADQKTYSLAGVAQEFPNGYSGVVHSSAAIKIALVTWSEPVAKASPTAERIMSGSGVSEIRDFYGGEWDSQHLIFEAGGGSFSAP